MTHADFHAAMLADPDDDVVRLVFADWLEEQGEPDRAAWVRLSVAVAELRVRVPFGAGQDAAADLFQLRADTETARRRCWPTEWTDIPGVTWQADRGLIRLIVRTKTGLSRLGGAGWLPAAQAAGWLGPVSTELLAGNYEAVLAAAWPKRAAAVVLYSRMPNRDWLFVNPDLYERTLAVRTTPPGLAARLAECSRLRVVTVVGLANGRIGDCFEVAAVVRAVPHLRRLRLRGLRNHAGETADDALTSLVSHPGLRRVELVRVSGVEGRPCALQEQDQVLVQAADQGHQVVARFGCPVARHLAFRLGRRFVGFRLGH